MRVMTDLEVKKVCLDILKYIKKVCDENGIHYSLTGGTLLGAIRHKGFIPWDDDIDIFMTRPEYIKFEKIMEKQGEYLWLTQKHDAKYHFNYGRVVEQNTIIIDDGLPDIDGYGVFVDVCVVDGLPANKIKRIFHIWFMRCLYRCRRSATYLNKEYIPHNPIKKVVKSLFQRYTRSVGVYNWVKRIEKYISRYPFDGSDYVGNVMSQYGAKEVMHRVSFDEYIELPFEDDFFSAIVGWEEYLKSIYGDYMKLPPIDQQKGHHMGTAYWINEEENS